jgi:transposase-like protein
MATSNGFDVAAAASRARWSTAVAREVLAAWSASGVSRREFAEKHGLQEQRLYNWERRLAEPDTTAGVQFREVMMPAVGIDSRLEVVLPNGTLIRISSSFDTTALARIVEVLGRIG